MRINDTVMVTGGAGFLGSHLCDRLVADGRDVLCVDNFYTGSKNNIRHLLSSKQFEFQRHDVTFPLYVEVGRIYNLACPASPIRSAWKRKTFKCSSGRKCRGTASCGHSASTG